MSPFVAAIDSLDLLFVADILILKRMHCIRHRTLGLLVYLKASVNYHPESSNVNLKNSIHYDKATTLLITALYMYISTHETNETHNPTCSTQVEHRSNILTYSIVALFPFFSTAF